MSSKPCTQNPVERAAKLMQRAQAEFDAASHHLDDCEMVLSELHSKLDVAIAKHRCAGDSLDRARAGLQWANENYRAMIDVHVRL